MAFLDIFSKKSKKIENKTRIIVDNREKNSLVASELTKLGFDVEFKQLPVADYLINDVAIERKTISDFKSSIINKRIINQLNEIKQYPKSLLILEGFDEGSYQGIIHENAFRGLIISISLEYKVPIIFTTDYKDTAKYISLLSTKKQSKNFSLRASKTILTEKERTEFILEGFSGIGPTTAKKLLSHFKTIKNIINASEEELKEVIGKKSEDFYKIINSKY